MRTFVVGDIHGGLKALDQVLAKVSYTREDRFIFLGDYVDGWSESAETVSFLIDFSKDYDCVFLKGNHDELLLNYLNSKEALPLWLVHGGAPTKEQYDALSKEEFNRHLQFFNKLKTYHINADNRLLCHAGFTNVKGPQYEYHSHITYWDRSLWEMACALDPNLSVEDERYPKRLRLFKEIYIGHTPVTRIGRDIPVNFANVWNIDTGAAFMGKLSMIDIDSKDVWQSDPVWTLYPGETGRN
jgi:serine/threonine protein phosphatase 1